LPLGCEVLLYDAVFILEALLLSTIVLVNGLESHFVNAVENVAFVLNVHLGEDFFHVLVLTVVQIGDVWVAGVPWSQHVLVKLVDAARALILVGQRLKLL